jgi:hypothetical protein
MSCICLTVEKKWGYNVTVYQLFTDSDKAVSPVVPMWTDASEECITSIFRAENQPSKKTACSRWLGMYISSQLVPRPQPLRSGLSSKNVVWTSHHPHVCCMSSWPHPSDLMSPIFGKDYKLWSSLRYFSQSCVTSSILVPVFSTAAHSQTLSACIIPLMHGTKFHINSNNKQNCGFVYFNF